MPVERSALERVFAIRGMPAGLRLLVCSRALNKANQRREPWLLMTWQ
jgi:hypothetical protein